MLAFTLSERSPLALFVCLAVVAAALLAAEPGHAFTNPITQLKRLYRETPVVAQGKAEAVILVPDTRAGRQAGQILAGRVKAATGVALPVTSDAAQADLRTTHVIALGNLLDNGVIERLYWNRYSFADKLYPGAGKFALRTVCSPYPWAAGRNAFLVEASDDAGLLAGAKALAERIGDGRDLVLPWTLVVSGAALPTPERRSEARQALKVSPSLRDFHAAAVAYLKTADPTHLDRARATLEALCPVYEAQPNRHLTWPEETTSEWIMPAWDGIEESDDLSDEERLRYTNLLLTQLRAHPQHIYEFRDLEKSTSITWNHITFPLMGLYFSSRYFRVYYPEVDAEQIALFGRKVEGCFGGQEKCWKPREDSAGYTAITPRHIMSWALAENRRAWIEQGFPRDLAAYMMATGDPMGYTAGHGDHPLARAKSDELGALALPFYLTRDGRLLWRLNQLVGGEWPNPYWRDVKPIPPTELVGLQIIPMHPEYYRWSDNLSFYGTPPTPHNVPLEKSFDKLAMRTGLTPDAQYLMLDGFGRGFHLHYDTNMIVKYTNAGQILLMDSDYLIRNTTEHCGLSVVRDGRAQQLIPTLASLDGRADLPGCLMSRTSVFDYNGVDWHRTLLMVKGGPVAVFDEAKAREPADYTLWCVWKTLDEGREEVVDARSFHVLRAGEAVGGFGVVKDPNARGGEALEFADPAAKLEFEVDLPKGACTLELRGRGTAGSNDSLWVRVGREEPLAFHLPQDALAGARGNWEQAAPAPTIPVARAGRQRFAITLRENPGSIVDTLRILDAEGKVRFDKRAVDVLASRAVRTPDHHFYVANSGGPSLQMSPRMNANNEAVKRLRQVANVRLGGGESYVYQNVLASVLGEPAVPDVRRLGDHAFATRVAGEDYLFGASTPEQPFTLGPLTIAARAFALGRGRLWVMDARSVLLAGKPLLQSEAPVSREVAWKGPSVGELLHAAGADGRSDGGRETGDGSLAAAPHGPVPGPPSPVVSPWSFTPDVPAYREGPEVLEVADVDGDGRAEILYASGNTLYVLDAGGKLRWQWAAGDRVRSCAVADLGAPDGRTVLVGSHDGFVTLLTPRGEKVRSWHCDVTLVSGQGHGSSPEVTAIAAADVNGDGKVEVLAGTRNCWLIAYTAEGAELWKKDKQYHGVRRILFADVDADGKPEILSANRYGGIAVFAGDGAAKPGTVSELGDVSMALGKCLPGDRPTIVNGSSTGVLKARRLGNDPREFEFSNQGFAVNEVACADVNADGLDEILVASETGYLYCLDGQGKDVWRVLLGAVVRDCAPADVDGDGRPEVIAAAEDGSAWIVSGAGKVLGRWSGAHPAILAGACPAEGGALALVALRDGTLHALRLGQE